MIIVILNIKNGEETKELCAFLFFGGGGERMAQKFRCSAHLVYVFVRFSASQLSLEPL